MEIKVLMVYHLELIYSLKLNLLIREIDIFYLFLMIFMGEENNIGVKIKISIV